MLTIQNAVTEYEVIDLLNIEPPSPSSYAQFVERYWRAATPTKRYDVHPSVLLRDWADNAIAGFVRNYLATSPVFTPRVDAAGGWGLPVTISREESRLMAAALVSAYLRTHVDDWLETGRNRDGSESPLRRDLLKSFVTHEAFRRHKRNLPRSLPLFPDPRGFRIMIAERLSEPSAQSFFEAQSVDAQRLFVGIMASDWSERLCKCRYPLCGKYFLCSKVRRSYRHGTFCSPEHRSRASADALTKRRRSDVRRELEEYAARQLAKWRSTSAWQDDNAVKLRLAVSLSTRMNEKAWLRAGRHDVRVNWVTRHSTAIEQRRLRLAGTEFQRQE
jgi:hypothetical protein